MLVTKIYLNAILSSLIQSQPYYFFIASTFMELIFVLFMVIVRPFTSRFSNFRIIIVSLVLIAANISMLIYIYNSQANSYQISYERLTVYLVLAVIGSASLFIILQHIMAWSKQMWRLVQPCLKGTRLMGHRVARFDFDDPSESMRKSAFKISQTTSFRGETYRNETE